MELPWRTITNNRIRFCSQRMSNPEPDEIFIIKLNNGLSGEQGRIALEIREIIARVCNVPPLYIHASDTTKQIVELLGVEGVIGWLFFEKYHGDDILVPLRRYLSELNMHYSDMEREDVPSLYLLPTIDSTVKEWVVSVITEIDKFRNKRRQLQ